MSGDVSTILNQPSLWNAVQMAQLRLDDGPEEEGYATSEDSLLAPPTPGMVAASPTSAIRDEDRKRKNREAARRLRNKTNKKQNDVKQDIMSLSSRQRALEYELISAAKELTALLKEAEEHRMSCNFQYKVNLPAIDPHVAKLGTVPELLRMSRAAQGQAAGLPPPRNSLPAAPTRVIPIEPQGEKRNREDNQVANNVDARTIKKLKKIINLGIQHQQQGGVAPQAGFSRELPVMAQRQAAARNYMEAGPSSRISAPFAIPSVVQQPIGTASEPPQLYEQNTEDPNLLLSVVRSYRTRSESSCASTVCHDMTSIDSTIQSKCDFPSQYRANPQHIQPPAYNAYMNSPRAVHTDATCSATSSISTVSAQFQTPTLQIPDWSILSDTAAPLDTMAPATSEPQIAAYPPDPVMVLQSACFHSQEDEAVNRIKQDLMGHMAEAEQMPMTLLRTSVQNSNSVGHVLEPLQLGQETGLNAWNQNQAEFSFLQVENQSFPIDNLGEMIANGMQAANGNEF